MENATVRTYNFPLFYLEKPFHTPAFWHIFYSESEFEAAALKAGGDNWRWPDEPTHDDLYEALVHDVSAHLLTDEIEEIVECYQNKAHPLHIVAGSLLRSELDSPPPALLDLLMEYGAETVKQWAATAEEAGL